jgi:bifunctional DNA-binding transcriptional regulator/antitoxin component of YhaV-PrlF toxin-antitoxin module
VAKADLIQLSDKIAIDGLWRIFQTSSMKMPTKTDSIRFTTRGQVVIPLWLRKEYHIEDGTRAIVTSTPEGILVKPVTRWAIERACGLLKRKPGAKPLAEEWAEHKRQERALEER